MALGDCSIPPTWDVSATLVLHYSMPQLFWFSQKLVIGARYNKGPLTTVVNWRISQDIQLDRDRYMNILIKAFLLIWFSTGNSDFWENSHMPIILSLFSALKQSRREVGCLPLYPSKFCGHLQSFSICIFFFRCYLFYQNFKIWPQMFFCFFFQSIPGVELILAETKF